MHVTPSAVSQQLAQLEHTVGRPLVDRSGRRASLTAAGRILATHAEAIEREVAQAQREIAALTGRTAGHVRVAAFPTVIRHLLIPAITILATEHPDVTCSITELDGVPALRHLRLGDVDLTITERDTELGAGPPSRLSVVPLTEDPYRVVVPGHWPVPHSYRDLADRPWIVGPAASANGQAFDRLARQQQFTPHRAHTCLDYPAMLALVAAGLGAAIAPDLALRGVDHTTIRVTPLPDAGRRRLDALITRGRTHMPAAEALVVAMRRVANPHPEQRPDSE